MSLVPVPSDQPQPESNCANCNVELVADQRYCLSCGKPVSPVRLAFLDALGPALPPPAPAGTLPAAWAPGGYELTPSGYVPVQENGAAGWARRNTGLIGLAAVLVLCLLTGLLVGHWVSQSKTPANQTIKVEGLGALGAATAAGSGGTSAANEAPSTSGGASSAPGSRRRRCRGDERSLQHLGRRISTAPSKAPPAKTRKTKKPASTKRRRKRRRRRSRNR